jgi:hypothetical protein
MKNYIPCLLFCLSVLPAALYAQGDSLVMRYLSAVRSHAQIYTGKSPLPYPAHLLGQPLLAFEEGVLYYDGLAYPQTNLLLDAYRGDLVVLTPDRLLEVIVEPELVDSAVFGGRHVFYLRPDGRKGCPAEGYYCRLYEGESVKALERIDYTLHEMRRDKEVSGWFGVAKTYYILREDTYYPVRSKGSVLKAIGSYRSELNAYARERKLRFGRTVAQSIASLLQQYEMLNRRRP